jgi:5,6-dimethylbenzimidazole synthase
MTAPPTHLPFDAAFRAAFRDLVLWRRDVRRFRSDPVDEARLDTLIELATHAPANARALEGYEGEQRATYAGLKLAGLKEAPIHLAVFSDEATTTGSGLGQQTMRETLRYSVVAAIQTLWLAARADGLGMGWISILDPASVTRALEVPASWTLVAYLCLGMPAEEHLDPELERHHWEVRHYTGDVVFAR